MNTELNQKNSSNRHIVFATIASLIVAGTILITAILPAEFNIDPLGTGKLLGIAGMSEVQNVGVLHTQEKPASEDVFEFTLAPFESLEYKYRLEEGATLLFEWSGTDQLKFDLHAEKDGVDPMEYSPSFDQRQSNGEQGSYTAPFSGLHGWYWENRTLNDVTLKLETTGFFSKAIEFRENYKNEKTF
ncbi:hypothetical protein [Aurantivibrio plasticivorans]